MKFTEWISDNLRYFLLFLAVALLIVLGVFGIKIYQSYEKTASDDKSIEILTESLKETEQPQTSQPETQTESETESESESESEKQTESESESETNGNASNMNAEGANDPLTSTDTNSSEGQNQEQTVSLPENIVPTITTDCNFRSTPELGDNIIGGCYPGQEVTIVGEENGWCQIVADGVTGYVAAEFVNTDGTWTPEAADQTAGSSGSEYTGETRSILSGCYLRSYPDYGDNILGECYAGQEVQFLGEEAGWYKVVADGVTGYIGPKFLG